MVLTVAVPIAIDIDINSRCPEVGRKQRPFTTATLRPKTTPTNHDRREKQSDKGAVFTTTPVHQK